MLFAFMNVRLYDGPSDFKGKINKRKRDNDSLKKNDQTLWNRQKCRDKSLTGGHQGGGWKGLTRKGYEGTFGVKGLPQSLS